MSRNWNHEHVAGGIAVGERSSSFARRVTMINPTEKSYHRCAFVLWFGAYGETRLHVYADSLEDALDECVDWAVDHAPGLLADEQVREAYQEALAQRIAAGADATDERVIEECQQEAEIDTTTAGNGGNYLLSWEWGIALERPSAADLYAYITGT
jgi:hypothetical protein